MVARTTTAVFHGNETKVWNENISYNTQVSRLLAWYNYTADKAKRLSYLKEYNKKHNIDNWTNISKVPDGHLNNIPHLLRLVTLGMPIKQDAINAALSKLKLLISQFNIPSPTVKTTKKDNSKICEYLDIYDKIIDDVQSQVISKWKISEMKLSTSDKSWLKDYYTKQRNELQEALETKDEGWDLTRPVILRRMVKLHDEILESLSVAKAPVVRKVKVKTPEQLSAKIKYKAEEKIGLLSIKSIKPSCLVNTTQIFMYNTKNRMLYKLETNTGTMSINNTKIIGWDATLSAGKKLRKPEDVLPLIKGKARGKLDKIWESLTTKPGKVVDRTHNDLILLTAI